MVNVIIVILGALFLACAFMFGPKMAVFKVYYVLKYAVLKPVEWLIRLIVALFGINEYIWMGFFVTACLFGACEPQGDVRQIGLLVLFIYAWLIFILIVRNFRDDDDKDCVQMLLARFEHKLCFGKKELSMYQHDWL